ncbi:iron complex outermembrane receptor protein [Paucibacter oligotrophus]|uniref:Iron complex outermembrane receptor protein n=1 Tax=Roseateles oligotrophus TaxID=1769250 RepID=A0A840L506_9BURK|nr:TonB-dependent receptor [Roseateles oligotrophus]MBB4841762.1 iron complex outermembrane receptor protein [Roseateles oligotrophus]
MSKPCFALTLLHRQLSAGLALLSITAQAQAQLGGPPASLERVVVSATRSEAQAFDVPAAISRVDGEELRERRAQVNLSEGLAVVPGLLARDRQNYAQDTQISLRGFGARASFGIRGLRLYVDGIPATLPDGQGQISHVDLASVARIEVLRGPVSALYGNSSGGVIQVFTEDGAGPKRLDLSLSKGADGLQRVASRFSGASGGFSYLLSLSQFDTDGYREHSQTRRRLGNAKLSWRPDEASRLSLVLNRVDLPLAQDPLGLTRAQMEADPRGVDPAALSFDTRKTMAQNQLGLVYERQLNTGNKILATLYGGSRSTTQFQSIPVATQKNPLHPGGVIDLERDYRGADLRWSLSSELLDGPLQMVAGLAYDQLKEERRGYLNYVGNSLGVLGELRRKEHNEVSNTDPYLQLSWQAAPGWNLNAGLRHTRVRFKSSDAYITAANPDDSGSADYRATLPVLGLLWSAAPGLHLYASAGRGFETPTLNELSYRPSGGTGLNFELQAARSKSLELGLKARGAALGELDLALFQTQTSQEIVTQTNVGGRATFQNAGRSRRLGLELAWRKTLLPDLQAQAAFTHLDAEYRDTFMTCTATPCTAAKQPIAAGNKIPGIAKRSLFMALNWAPPQGWRAGLEARALSRVFVNDLNSDAAPGHGLLSANAGYLLRLGVWELNGFVRVDNLFDRQVPGSVIVNDGNNRFFEPAPGRNWLASVSAAMRF